MEVDHTHYISLEFVVTLLGTIIPALLASAGFWAWVSRRQTIKGKSRDLLIGLAHDRIMTLCMCHIDRGYITAEEFENLHTYLYKPYIELGANGSAQRLMAEVTKLPIRNLREVVQTTGEETS